jgi:hypothetical protein
MSSLVCRIPFAAQLEADCIMLAIIVVNGGVLIFSFGVASCGPAGRSGTKSAT